jgi:ADP-L-glycero-D-manno-heptose 6-epimerase
MDLDVEMKVLLTGYKGFIGQHMLVALEKEGHNVSTFDWDDGNMPSVMEQDWVIHMGAISSTTERDVEKVMIQNYDFTTQLYEACHTFGVNFQFSSSASVYGLISTFSEEAPVHPKTPYAWSKYLCERYIERHPMGATTQVFRYFNVYGPEGEEHKGDQASPYYKFTQQAKTSGKIDIFDNSNLYSRDFIHVSEIVDYHLKFMKIEKSGLFNLGTGKTKSFLEVASEIGKKYPSVINYIPMPDNLKDSYQKYTCADMTKTKEALGETKIY